MPTAVLVAEPEPTTRGFLERHLTDDGFRVVGAAAGCEALELAERERPHLVLLDTALPDESGLELCRRLRDGEPGRFWDTDVPVILLGPQESDAVDRIRGFARGADDYVAKPFVYDELVARMRAVLRRTAPDPPATVTAGTITIDLGARRVTVGGEPVTLAGKEYALLLRLAGDPTRVFTKEELLRDVWGFRSRGRTRTLDSHASRLRRKLARPGGDEYVRNVWGVGYRLVGD
jgi:DNA-binding response OmpR family regulator